MPRYENTENEIDQLESFEFCNQSKNLWTLIVYTQEIHLKMATSNSGNLDVDDENGVDQGNLLRVRRYEFSISLLVFSSLTTFKMFFKNN